MGSGMANIWIRSSGGELFRADVLVHLRCHDGLVEASGPGGRRVPLTESGCPSDFHVQLLLELARVNLDDRWVVIISPEGTGDSAKWTRATAEELVGAHENGRRVSLKQGGTAPT
jgi:hypothetical protein